MPNHTASAGQTTFLKRLLKRRKAVVGLVILAVEVALVIVLPIVMNLDPYTSDTAAFNAAPSAAHLLGTDDVGRDIFARLLYGGRVSLIVGVSSMCISIALGVPLGLIAGYFRGAWEAVIMRAADIFMSFPSLVLILVIVAVFGSSLPIIVCVIGLLGWTQPAKLVYSNVLSVTRQEYVESALGLGLGDAQIIFKYVLPNVISPVWASMAFNISSAITTEASLSFLGMGIQAPEASWGNMVNSAQQYVTMIARQWMWLPAGICLVVTIIAVNLVGESIRDVYDPRSM